ncbi:MAG: DNA mismatch repair protein MutS [Gammaproteobacteria bacterium]|nr:DNA mismatch repair protein MutS [Gammaproteobacteria bacterium]
MANQRPPTKTPAPSPARAAPPGAEDAAFRAALAGVTRLHSDTMDLRQPGPPPVPLQSRRDQQAVMAELLMLDPGEGEMETGDEILFKRNGVQNAVMRKLRRGEYSIQAHIDLHGLTTPEAKSALSEFLRASVQRGHHCVRIVHGKGQRSPGRVPVLKPKVAHWLVQWEEVMAYISTPATDGGTGAIYVLLRQRR